MNRVSQLRNVKKNHDFFIGFDSDGCVFDSMALKHKECFCPAYIKHFKLQSVSTAAREVWDFVNLYSQTRGCNRFLAIRCAMDLLAQRKDVQARGFVPMELKEFDAWLARETKLGNPALMQAVEQTGNEELRLLLDWSLEVNARVQDMVFGVPPFPGVMEVLLQGHAQADMMVVSQTPLAAIEREWAENRMDGYVELIAAQEHGTKTEHIHFATDGKGYDSEKILMVGDAPGDRQAAFDNHALFYPIVPGREEHSWARLAAEGLQKFFAGTFCGDYQQMLVREFDKALPERPG
jgi:phosphoglycolate phosphatase-like HAD superfamily hydrolase